MFKHKIGDLVKENGELLLIIQDKMNNFKIGDLIMENHDESEFVRRGIIISDLHISSLSPNYYFYALMSSNFHKKLRIITYSMYDIPNLTLLA